ncbi:MAG: hypothetical protein HQL84_02555 [Magnetococcales bacterium]|nr:hypothetical protein [Magnetococcales bacterium]MBF0148907.1 hypothetical protein [Magnetococcales bacterium]MBF0172936.1 hypothetical protein [Magnetococcales bacterium]MBF0630106.1 hypothetical protein [Magnetococcales bacterium]
MTRITTLLLLLSGLFPSALEAAWYPKEFSAEVQWTLPTDPRVSAPAEKITGKVYAGNQRMRIEATTQNKTHALIVHEGGKKAWTLNPETKSYHDGVGKVPMLPKPDIDILPSDPDSPCAKKNKVTCNSTGSDTLDGVAVEKWTISIHQNNQKGEILLWIDPKRRLVLKQQPNLGPQHTRILVGEVDHGGRPTEKWTITETFQGQSHTMEQWVDKELRLIVRQSGPVGDFLLVQNIQVAPQPQNLFQIPAEFKQTLPPAPKPLPGGNP